MKEFEVRMPIAGVAVKIIEAETKEDAIKEFMDTVDVVIDFSKSNVDHIEFEYHQKIVDGNFFFGVANEVVVEDLGEIDEDD